MPKLNVCLINCRNKFTGCLLSDKGLKHITFKSLFCVLILLKIFNSLVFQIKEVLKMNHKVKAPQQWQPKSHLPMGMIVSKMATRTPVRPIEESEDPLPSLQDNTDFSMLR